MPKTIRLLPLLLLFCSGCLNLIKPVHRFSVAAAGPAPVYADTTAWLVLPGHPGASRQHPPGLPLPAPDTVADVFYVHPTTYFWHFGYWNAPLCLKRLERFTVRTTIRNQATLFTPVGRLYAPRYRQATLFAFFAKPTNPNVQPAFDLAYADVKASFQYYLAHYNHGRPFVLAGHSQGTLLATRLLHELVDEDPALRQRLVVAYLVGYQAHPDEYRHLPALRDSLQTGGIVAWNTAVRGHSFRPYRGLLVVNPLTWTLDSTHAPAALNRGGVPLSFRRFDPHITGTEIHNGLLWADKPARPGYHRLHIPGLPRLSDSYHLVDYNFFYLNVRENARARIRAWARQHPPLR